MLGSQSRRLVLPLCDGRARIFPKVRALSGWQQRPIRESPLPPLTNPVENAIAGAQGRGELDNLGGAGKPLPKGNPNTGMAGVTSSELLSKRAEFEMRRAIHNKELDDVAGKGEKRKYQGTGIAPTMGGGSDGGGAGAGNAMSQYILKQSSASVSDMKNMQK